MERTKERTNDERRRRVRQQTRHCAGPITYNCCTPYVYTTELPDIQATYGIMYTAMYMQCTVYTNSVCRSISEI